MGKVLFPYTVPIKDGESALSLYCTYKIWGKCPTPAAQCHTDLHIAHILAPQLDMRGQGAAALRAQAEGARRAVLCCVRAQAASSAIPWQEARCRASAHKPTPPWQQPVESQLKPLAGTCAAGCRLACSRVCAHLAFCCSFCCCFSLENKNSCMCACLASKLFL